MNSPEKPIPISRGKEINIQKFIDILNQKLSMLENWHADIGKRIKDKEVLYNREFMKAEDKRNYDLIASLAAEIKESNEDEKKIFDLMLSADDLLQKNKESLRDYQELSDLVEEIASLEQILKEENPEHK